MSKFPAARFLDRTTPPHLVSLILIAGIAALSMNIFLPSLTEIAEHFSTDYRLIQLSVAIYLAFNAGMQIFVGPLSDYYGRRNVLLIGLGIFLVATLGCVLAPNVEVFLTFRMIQATVVVGMVLSRAIVRDMYPTEQAAAQLSYVIMGMTIAPMFGPVVGGFLGDAYGWQATFWLLAAFGFVIFAICWADLGETNLHRSASFKEQARQYPELLASPRFWGYCLASAFASGAFFAFLGGAPFVGAELYGLSASKLGLYLGAPTVGYFLGNWISGQTSTRLGIDRLILWGAIIVTSGLGLVLALFYADLGSAEVFFGFMTIVGLGNGLVIPNANVGLLSVRPHLAGSASGLGGAIMIGGGAILSAMAGAMLTPTTGAFPLLWIMFATSGLSICAIVFVMHRARLIAAQ